MTEHDHHANHQRRDKTSQQFVGNYARERLPFVVREVALHLHPGEPTKLTVSEFSDHAADVMAALGEPEPPKGRAVYAALNRIGRKKGWKQHVADAVAGENALSHTVKLATRERPAWHFDEGNLVYALRRIGNELGCELGQPGPRPNDYDQTRDALILADRRLGRGCFLADILPTSGQIETIAGDHGWAGACELAGYQAPGAVAVQRGFDPIKLLAHYYETKRRLPGFEPFRKHAASLNIPLPADTGRRWTQIKQQFVADRAARGIDTPKNGPIPGQELTQAELDALLDGAPRQHRKGHWHVLDNTLAALAAYIERYEHETSLRQRHYLAVYEGEGWPPPSAVTECAKKHDIGNEKERFQPMLEAARGWARTRENRAA